MRLGTWPCRRPRSPVLGVLSIHIHVHMQALSLNSRVLSGMYLLVQLSLIQREGEAVRARERERAREIYTYTRIYAFWYAACFCQQNLLLHLFRKVHIQNLAQIAASATAAATRAKASFKQATFGRGELTV